MQPLVTWWAWSCPPPTAETTRNPRSSLSAPQPPVAIVSLCSWGHGQVSWESMGEEEGPGMPAGPFPIPSHSAREQPVNHPARDGCRRTGEALSVSTIRTDPPRTLCRISTLRPCPHRGLHGVPSPGVAAAGHHLCPALGTWRGQPGSPCRRSSHRAPLPAATHAVVQGRVSQAQEGRLGMGPASVSMPTMSKTGWQAWPECGQSQKGGAGRKGCGHAERGNS